MQEAARKFTLKPRDYLTINIGMMAGLLVMLSIAPMGVIKEPSILPRLTMVVGFDFLAFGASTFILISAGMKGELSSRDLRFASWSCLIGILTAIAIILVLTVVAYIYDLFSQFTISATS